MRSLDDPAELSTQGAAARQTRKRLDLTVETMAAKGTL
jgi:hypothetical protein